MPLYGYSIGGKYLIFVFESTLENSSYKKLFLSGDESCLVYQLMSGGSLEDRLKCKDNRPPLLWNQRLTIAQGVARLVNH